MNFAEHLKQTVAQEKAKQLQKNISIVIKSEFSMGSMQTRIVNVYSDYSDAEKYLEENKSDDLTIENWTVDFKE